ncbi:hypothetical protein [Flavobacterium nackdongense]|uniref:Uncharacterized protein n=1 Tax=Flavobacterium nackdongense TaxID=2547394 RepID=A0A4P6YF76_9FLAO|nr:hypothetical protein [Flavobacterium nackdongense]QBN19405.1 hypothetical protein E1750_11550 [Flavobacterium nackdongense]
MKHDKNFYLLALLTFVSIVSLIVGFVSNWVFNAQLWIGLSLLISCFIAYYKFFQRFKTLLGIILILGVLTGIQFVPFQFSIQLGFIKFEVVPTIFLVLFLFLNRGRVVDILQDWFKTPTEEIEKRSLSKYESFKKDFQNLSDQEIEHRLNQHLVPEARKALIEIKEVRNS